jgi:hypothetical protein
MTAPFPPTSSFPSLSKDTAVNRENDDVPVGHTQSFEVESGTRLWLLDLPGEVHVRPAPTESAESAGSRVTVTVYGTAAAREQVDVRAVGGAVEVRGTRPAGVVIGGMQGVVTGGSMSFTGLTFTGGVIAGGRVVVDGVDVTDILTGGARSGRAVRAARVEVLVPAATMVVVEGCARTEVRDVVGSVRASLAGQDALGVHGATDARVTASGQADVRLIAGIGDVSVAASGMARVRVEGSHGDLDAQASGQATLDAHGMFWRVVGRASGLALIAVTGQVGSRRLHATEMATATVNGQAATR